MFRHLDPGAEAPQNGGGRLRAVLGLDQHQHLARLELTLVVAGLFLREAHAE